MIWRAPSADVWGSMLALTVLASCLLIRIYFSSFSRLETIFEVPTSRKNGSVSSFGQKRIKRFLEFLEVGEARKPKKPLVGVGKAGTSTSRTRRGGFPKDAAPLLGVQDVDSLLCAKLHQLNLWLIQDQSDGWSLPLQHSFGSLYRKQLNMFLCFKPYLCRRIFQPCILQHLQSALWRTDKI